MEQCVNLDSYKDEVWNKAIKYDGYDPREMRKDIMGLYIKYKHYGRKTDFGWVIDFIVPLDRGGSGKLENMQPLHWQNKRYRDVKRDLSEPQLSDY